MSEYEDLVALEVALDQFFSRLGYTYDSSLDEIAEEVERLRSGIQWARGMCSDCDPHAEIDEHLGEILNP